MLSKGLMELGSLTTRLLCAGENDSGPEQREETSIHGIEHKLRI